MQTVDPHDQQTTQIQSVDNLVSEIRQIADHIYQEGVQEPAPNSALSGPKSPQSSHRSQQQSVQPPQEPLSGFTEREASKVDSSAQFIKRPPLNPGDISKGLSKLHARVDEVLRRTPQRRLNDSAVLDSISKPVDARTSYVPETSHEAHYRSNITSIRPEEGYKSSQVMSNYMSLQKSSALPTTASLSKPPVGMHVQSSSISTSAFHQPQDLIYSNPFSDNALSRTGEYEARKSLIPNVGSYSTSLGSHLSPTATVNIAPWSTNSDLIKTQRDDRPFRSPSMLESGIGRGLPTDVSAYNHGLREIRVDHNTGYADSNRLSTIIHQGIPSEHIPTPPLMQSASAPAFKPRYDRSKLDSIIANIRNRDTGSASLYQSQAPPAIDTSSYSRIQDSVAQYDSKTGPKQAAFFSGDHHARQNNYESAPREYASPAREYPHTNNMQHYNPMSNSRLVSPPGQFSSPQNVIPSSNVYPSNPFNQPRYPTEPEEPTDYYGVFQQPQREYERERRYNDYPQEHFTPKQNDIGYVRAYPDQNRGYQGHQQSHRTPEYDGRYQQQRYREPDTYNRYEQEEPYDRYGRDDRYERYEGHRDDEFGRRMGPSEIKRGLNREGNRRDDFGDRAFGEFENDDDSLVEDQKPVRGKARGKTKKQENPHLFGGLESDESFTSAQESYVEPNQPRLRPGRRGASRARQETSKVQESGFSDRKQIPKPVTAPRQELVKNQERPGATRRGASTRGRRAELGGGDLVYGNVNRDDTGTTSVQKKQSFGHEQGRGSSVPRRTAKERDSVNNARDFQVKESTPLRNSRAPPQESEKAYAAMRNSANKPATNPKDYLNNEDELSDFDFDNNRDDFAANDNRGRGKASQPVARDEDSVTRAFERARNENSGRKAPVYNSGRDAVSQKTEMMPSANSGRRKVFR